MKKTQLKKMLSLILCIVLIAAVALCTVGCNDNKDNTSSKAETSAVNGVKINFKFTVVDADGNETSFDVSTDKKTVGEALLDEGLIEGDKGPYGLYVKTVNGVTLDYDTDGMYWAFYVNGKYGSAGVDATDAAEGDSYAFKAEK